MYRDRDIQIIQTGRQTDRETYIPETHIHIYRYREIYI